MGSRFFSFAPFHAKPHWVRQLKVVQETWVHFLLEATETSPRSFSPYVFARGHFVDVRICKSEHEQCRLQPQTFYTRVHCPSEPLVWMMSCVHITADMRKMYHSGILMWLNLNGLLRKLYNLILFDNIYLNESR